MLTFITLGEFYFSLTRSGNALLGPCFKTGAFAQNVKLRSRDVSSGINVINPSIQALV